VAASDPAAALEIIAGLRRIYDEHHHMTITEGALSAAVTISVQAAPRRHLPDEALDLLEEACAMLGDSRTGLDRPSVSAADTRAVTVERSWTGAGTSEEVRDGC
jgi:ATP-dependent Clp protease ATP-binding subunit ClpA